MSGSRSTKTLAIEIFRAAGGQLRMKEALELGINRSMLYTLRDLGLIEKVSRGVFRLEELPPLQNPDLVTVSSRFPNAVICLISALSFHGMTTQVPHYVYIAVARGTLKPSLDYPPLKVHHYSGSAFHEGVEEHSIDNVVVKIYCPEKTLADCFKFRNKIGMDIFLEALKFYRNNKAMDVKKLLKYAKVCRVERAIRPYLEASL